MFIKVKVLPHNEIGQIVLGESKLFSTFYLLKRKNIVADKPKFIKNQVVSEIFNTACIMGLSVVILLLYVY